ncbi:MAG: hypothetical protein ACI4LX_01615 [Treponema sp.]
MKKKFIIAAFLFCAVEILAVSQNFDRISQIIETKKITVAQASYLVANYLGVVEEDADEQTAFEKLLSSGYFSPEQKADEFISLQNLCALYAKAANQKGGMMFTLTKKSGRYSYREFRAKGYIPPYADPMMKVSGADAIGLLNAVIKE